MAFDKRSLLTAITLALGAFALGPVGTLELTNGNISPDGFTRAAVLAGGTFPGPVITATKGDHIAITVDNQLTDHSMFKTTSVHWHGFFQHGSNWADGPAMINQCPIASGNSFTYDFQVPDQAGTFWYHSHLSTQYCDGFRGVFVVKDPNDPHASLYDVDDDTTIITLADWYHVVSTAGPEFPEADSTLINGLGRFAGNPTSNLAVITVQAGKKYRFRLVSISCDPDYLFSIDNHVVDIIEADGVNTEPQTGVDQVHIFAGQRYSMVLNANQPVGNYWIRANPNQGNLGFDNGINSAILRYQGAPVAEPTTSAPTTFANPLNEATLVPLENPGAPGVPTPGAADVNINLAIAFQGTRDDGLFTVNGVQFEPPTVPVLLQILSGTTDPSQLMPSGSLYALPSNKVIELSLPAGAAGGPHPMHLHGHVFDVIRVSGSTTYNFENPVRRDVVSLGTTGDNVTLRFTTDNPGPWFLHCHIDYHLDHGLAVVFVEDTPDIASANPVPQAWSDLCPTYNNLAPGDQ